MPLDAPIAIIGAGATGLAAAHALVRRGQRVRVFESAPTTGGVVRSERDGDWLVEAGPNSLQETPTVAALVQELGLSSERCAAQPAAKRRYIVREGHLRAAPTSPPGLFSTTLFSWGAKLRVLTELTRRPRTRAADISLAEFVGAHFGSEFVDYALNPFVSGVYAGDPERLSARHAFPSLWQAERTHGSLVRAQIAAAKARRARGEPPGPPPIISFQHGLATLTQRLTAQLPAGALEVSCRVETLVRDQPWKLIWSRGGETHTETFSRILLALPAPALAQITVGTLGERPLAELQAVEYPPVASVFLGYEREQVAHPLDGFGVLFPQREHRQALGVLFSSTLFPGRAPAGHVALTVMLGGALRPDLGRAPAEQAVAVARQEVETLLGAQGEPVYVRHHAWPRAIPQYSLGYQRFHEVIEQAEQEHGGLLVGGQVRDGIALSACLAAGQKLAERALS